jgi:hypothetical protein
MPSFDYSQAAPVTARAVRATLGTVRRCPVAACPTGRLA